MDVRKIRRRSEGGERRAREILPGVGLGSLRFGMSEAEIEGILGEPDEIAEFEDSDRHVYYSRLGIFLFFSGDDEGRLSSLEVNAGCHCALAGKEVFPARRKQVVNLLRSLNPGSFGMDEAVVIHLEGEGETRLCHRELGMDFYFSSDGSLESIQWGPTA